MELAKELKNKYGTNKLERLINKTKAYFNLDLKSISNNYLSVVKPDKDCELLFVVNNYETLYLPTKYGRKLKIENGNMQSPVWVNDYYTLEVGDGNGNTVGYIVKSNHPGLLEQIQGCEYVYKLFDFMENSKSGLYIRKP